MRIEIAFETKSHPKFKPTYNRNFILLLALLLTTLHCKIL